MTRPAILDLDLVVVPREATDEMLHHFTAKNDEAVKRGWYGLHPLQAHHAMLSASPYHTAWDDVRKYVEGLEERLRSETFRADVNDKILTKHFEASQAKSVEIQNLKAYIDKTAKDVAETITEIRKRDVSVDQRMRAEAAESRIAELEADLLEERLAMSGRIQFLEDASAVPHLEHRIAELEKRLADAEMVIKPFARIGRMSTHSINEDGTASFSFFRTADMNAFTDARRAARAYMEGK